MCTPYKCSEYNVDYSFLQCLIIEHVSPTLSVVIKYPSCSNLICAYYLIVSQVNIGVFLY